MWQEREGGRERGKKGERERGGGWRERDRGGRDGYVGTTRTLLKVTAQMDA